MPSLNVNLDARFEESLTVKDQCAEAIRVLNLVTPLHTMFKAQEVVWNYSYAYRGVVITYVHEGQYVVKLFGIPASDARYFQAMNIAYQYAFVRDALKILHQTLIEDGVVEDSTCYKIL